VRTGNKTRLSFFAVMVVSAFMVVAGCDSGAGDTNAGKTGNEVSILTGELSPEAMQLMASADALDGKTDKHVEKCYVCGLAMAGKSDCATQLGEYRLDFCSAPCRTQFNENPEKLVTSTKIPEPPNN
jgi:uncharacterized membrane protein